LFVDNSEEPARLDSQNKLMSIDSFEKQPPTTVDSDDSMEEYADPDPSKFNEDGSFIGQYGVKSPITAERQPMTSDTQPAFATLV